MADLNAVIHRIRTAFANVDYPGDSDLRNSNEGEEPFLLEAEFMGKNDWTVIDPSFIDQAPDGFSSALSFFSAAAFRFYLPAYLLADLDGGLHSVNPVFHLTHGLTHGTKDARINPIRYGEYTWFEYVTERFAGFSPLEVGAILAYLELKRDSADTDYERDLIGEALEIYWLERSKGD
jgi:hypothetical protein